MFCQRLISNACTSAVCGAGPVYAFALDEPLVAWFTAVDGPPAVQAARPEMRTQAVATLIVCAFATSDPIPFIRCFRVIAALSYWPGQAAAACWKTCFSL